MEGDRFNLSFLTVGPQRTATSLLDYLLRQHPGIALPQKTKETMYWDKYNDKPIDWYAKHFRTTNNSCQFGEIAPTLFPCLKACQKVKETFPLCKIIILYRDPIERTWSHYLHEKALGLQNGSLHEAITSDPRIIEASRYRKYIPMWIDHFGKRRVLVIKQNALTEKAEDTLSVILNFLHLSKDYSFKLPNKKLSQSVKTTNPFLANLFYKTARFLRSKGAHDLVNTLKRTGIRKIAYRKREEFNKEIPKEEKGFLSRELFDEYSNS